MTTRRAEALARRGAKYRKRLTAAATPAARVGEDVRYLASVAAVVIASGDPAVTATVRNLIRECTGKVIALANTRRTK